MVYESLKVTQSKVIESEHTAYGEGARDLWKRKYCQKDVSGSGNYLWGVLKPNSEEDFYNKFVSYASGNKSKPIAYRGLDEDELMNLAKSFKTDFEVNAGCSYPVEVYYNYMLLHLIQEPFNGHRKELEMLEYLLSRGKDARLADGELDIKYKIDILVGDDIGIQIKRETFLYSKKENVMKAVEDLTRSKDKVKEKFGITMYYGVYKSDGTWMRTDDGKILFTYDEFIRKRK